MGRYAITDNQYTAFVALMCGSIAAEDNHVTIKSSLQKAWAQVGKTLHMEPQEWTEKNKIKNTKKKKWEGGYFLIKAGHSLSQINALSYIISQIN